MIRRPPRATRTDTLFPYTTLFRSIPRQIGCFRADGAGFVGRVQTLTLDVAVRLVPTGFADHGRAPDWRVHFYDQALPDGVGIEIRSEEQTSELQSLMRISYAVFCLTKKREYKTIHDNK